MTSRSLFAAVFLTLLPCSLFAADDADGWISPFNGKDLSNWINVNCAPETWTVGDGVIKCTGSPTGALRLPNQYENFIFEVEWRHMKSAGNAGIFVWASPVAAPGVPFLRGIEVQVLDHGYAKNADPNKPRWFTTHGDVFPIHGSSMKPIHAGSGQRCFPIEERSKPSPEWNHYRIEANNGKLRLSVNGKEVSGGDNCVWRKGYLGLESEGSPTEWRNLRIKELPSTGATEAVSAPLDQQWKNLFTGIDLRGWTAAKGDATAWKTGDWTLNRPAPADDSISRELPSSRFVLTLDWRGGKETPAAPFEVKFKDSNGGTHVIDLAKSLPEKANAAGWNRLEVNSQDLKGLAPGKWSLELQAATAPPQFANFYVRELP